MLSTEELDEFWLEILLNTVLANDNSNSTKLNKSASLITLV